MTEKSDESMARREEALAAENERLRRENAALRAAYHEVIELLNTIRSLLR